LLPVVLVPHPHVRVESTVLGGSPYVAGSRVPVRRVFAFYRDGAKVETILKRFPQLGPARIFDSIAFALDNPEVMEADLATERQLLERAGSRNARRGRPSDQQIALPFGSPQQDEPKGHSEK
jgi:uncharacterized protein (DUF433 family)